MKDKLMTAVKYFKFLYSIYFYIMSTAIRIMRLFVKPDDKLVLFNSFGGKKFDDSPKAIFDVMKTDDRFKEYKFVWAFHSPVKFAVEGAKVIKTDTFEYFKTALKARCWITNSGIERGLDFKGKNTFYFNTWHGTPIKRMGADIADTNKSFKSKGGNKTDIMTAQGDFEADIFSRVFGISPEKFLLCGLPRNDKLANYKEQDKKSIKNRLGIPEGKKVILYAPTFREFERDEKHNCVLKPPMNLSKWRAELGDEYCLLFRAHYEVANVMKIENDGFVFNMSSYPLLEDLMIAADILISDYSSILFDFSIMDKIMLHFTYDYEKYSSNRGMYFDIRDYISGADNETDLINHIKNMDIEDELNRTVVFRNKYVNYYGNAVRQSVDCIFDNIGGNK